MEQKKSLKKIAFAQQFISLFGLLIVFFGVFSVYFLSNSFYSKELYPGISSIILFVGSLLVILDSFIIRKNISSNIKLLPFLLYTGYFLTFSGLIILTNSLINGFRLSFQIYSGLVSVLMGSICVIGHNLFKEKRNINLTGFDSSNQSFAELTDVIKKIIKIEIDNNPNQFVIEKNKNSKIENNKVEQNIDFAQSKDRLEKEVKNLSNRANSNLFVGGLTAIIGVILLIYFIAPNNHIINIKDLTIKDAPNLVLSYIPRLSTILLIEIIAFFFLRLYKSTLDDIKYFQNEITNIESKSIALNNVIDIDSDSDKLLSYVIEKIADTERNFLLDKGQSSIEVEKLKFDSNRINELLKSISDLLKNR